MTDEIASPQKDGREVFGGNFLNYVLDQLSDMDNFTFKKMLGGIGFYRNDLLFGAISGGKFRLKTAHKCEGEQAPSPAANRYSFNQLREELFCIVPTEVLRNKTILTQWANMAYEAAVDAQN